MSTDLKIGVIGAGGRGGLTGNAHRPGEGSRVIAGADTRPEVLAQFRDRYGADCLTTADYRELLAREDVDAVFVCTPDFLHEEHAVAALRAGKAVYLEKPMAITIAGCDHILETAYETGSRLYLGHNMRHFEVVTTMKRLIDEGAVGEVQAGWCRHFVSYGGDAYFKDWHADRRTQTGLLLQKAAHDIDVLHWLCGGYSKSVVAMGDLMVYNRITDRHDPAERGNAAFVAGNWPPLSQKQLNPVVDVEDLSMMLMRLDNGVMCSYQQCHFTPDAWRNYTIIGTEGRIENYGDGGPATIQVWNKRLDNCRMCGDAHVYVPPAGGGHAGADPKIVGEFLRFVREGGQTNTNPVAGRYAVAAGCQATASLRDGSTPRDVPDLDPALRAYFENGQVR